MWKNTKKIIGIGRNYAEHAKELGNAIPSKPMIFLKPSSSIIQMPQYIEVPRNATVHYELEVGVVIQGFARDVKEDRAMDHVKGYCLGLDMTARNIQDECKKAGHPWTVAKGYDTFTPLSVFIKKELIKDPHNLNLQLLLDQKKVQDGNTRDMIFKIPKLIAYCSSIMSLEDGDIILTGTPEGVGPVLPGQILVGKLSSEGIQLAEMKFPVKNR
jgi:acylpyruvate hydrolase